MAIAADASYTAMASRGGGAHETVLAQLADGPVLLRVRAVDSQGVSHPDVVRTVTVDNTPPAIEQLSVADGGRSEEHTSELQSPCNLVCRLLLEKKKKTTSRILCTTTSRLR